MSDIPPPINQDQLRRAYNSVDMVGLAAEPAKVQWAARRAVAALERLSLELHIAAARRDAERATDEAKRQTKLARTLTALRGKDRR